jgi:hypothetical protein
MSFYEDMPKDFKNAVEVIQKYCQNENCDIQDCHNCEYPLGYIRPTDTFDYKVIHCKKVCEITQMNVFAECKDKECGDCDYFEVIEGRSL